jgi:hypothetical protein
LDNLVAQELLSRPNNYLINCSVTKLFDYPRPIGPQLAQHLHEEPMPTPPKPSPQADGTPESLHKSPNRQPGDRADDRPPHTQTEAGDEHLGAKENQVSNTAAPAGQAYDDEPKQG